jgi:uncharacterized protein
MKLKLFFFHVFFFLMVIGGSPLVHSETQPNRLIHEKSPYLLQHAYNPVDWYAWGAEAFDKAKAENKPILLSIGYSTCHWCHVMEEESFSNPEIAKLMNETVVAIKVDREERPDVDHIYMQAVMAMTGSGGWPLNVFLTHDLKPFFGGTYFPPDDRWGRPGFVSVLKMVGEKWTLARDQILKSGSEISNFLNQLSLEQSGETKTLGEDTLKTAFQQLGSRFNSAKGGYGNAPKFPQSHMNSFLLGYWKRTNSREALEMVQKTLDEMARGGICDHLGGGFHRYSTDDDWFVPHFEKMLYDQAIIAKSYLNAFQATGKESYANVARDIFEYVLRDLTGSEGAFYSAEDADSYLPELAQKTKKSEGAFYIWLETEITGHLGSEDATIFNYHFGVEPHGNVSNDPHGEFTEKNILYLERTTPETAKKFGTSEQRVLDIIQRGKLKLFELRSKRPRPQLDDKILTDWNGLMISSFALGARVLDEPKYQEAAVRAADFILEKLKKEDGRLLHRYRDGDASVTGFLEDYSFFANGLIDLYEATFEVRYLEEAKLLLKEMHRLFWDEANGGFFFTADDAEKLILRSKEIYDGAIPSGNSVAALALLRAGRIFMDHEMDGWVKKTLDGFSALISEKPAGFTQMMIALDFAVGPSQEVVIVGDPKEEVTQEMIRVVNSYFAPNQVLLVHPTNKNEAKKIEALAPFIEKQIALDDKPTAYVCRNYMCKLPTSDIDQLKELLGGA